MTSSLSPPASDWPKSNSIFQSGSTSLRIAENGRPILLRKPCSGPMVLSRISSWASAGSSRRDDGDLVIDQSQPLQAKRR